MKTETRKHVCDIIEDCVKRAIERSAADNLGHKPFHEELLTPELLVASAFERSFSSSFGQGTIEQISEILASTSGAKAKRQYDKEVLLPQETFEEVDKIMSELRVGTGKPDWHSELKRLVEKSTGDRISRRVRADLWFNRDGTDSFFSIKTVKPNIDQTEVAKRDLLLLKANDQKCNVFFALYYNPGGKQRSDYNWSPPSRIFNMHQDTCVLIGKDYWDYVGGQGTYEMLLGIFNEVGGKTRASLTKS